MKPEAIEQGRRWLEQAEADRRGAQLLLEGGLLVLVGEKLGRLRGAAG